MLESRGLFRSGRNLRSSFVYGRTTDPYLPLQQPRATGTQQVRRMRRIRQLVGLEIAKEIVLVLEGRTLDIDLRQGPGRTQEAFALKMAGEVGHQGKQCQRSHGHRPQERLSVHL